MRVLHYLAMLAVVSGLTGCSCLPGGGGAESALETLKQPAPALRRDEILSTRF